MCRVYSRIHTGSRLDDDVLYLYLEKLDSIWILGNVMDNGVPDWTHEIRATPRFAPSRKRNAATYRPAEIAGPTTAQLGPHRQAGAQWRSRESGGR